MYLSYCCLHVLSRQIYISRHVIFYEALFSFGITKQSNSTSQARTHSSPPASSEEILGPSPQLPQNIIRFITSMENNLNQLDTTPQHLLASQLIMLKNQAHLRHLHRAHVITKFHHTTSTHTSTCEHLQRY